MACRAYILFAVVLLSLSLSLGSCTQKMLDEAPRRTARVHIDFDWTDAECDSPHNMSVYFYPADGQNLPVQRFDLGGAGGDIDIVPGTYRLLGYNSDSDAALLRGHENFETHEIYTRRCGVLEPVVGVSDRTDADDHPSVLCPDPMWSCWASATVTDSTRIVLAPHSRCSLYIIKMTDIENLDGVSAMCVSVGALAGSAFMGHDSTGAQCATLSTTAMPVNETEAYGEMYTFGHNPANQLPHVLTVYAWMADGSMERHKFDVSAQIDTVPASRRIVTIAVSGLKFSEVSGNDSGLNPRIDDWDNEDRDLLM